MRVFSKPNPSINDVKGSGYTHDISSPSFSWLGINKSSHVTTRHSRDFRNILCSLPPAPLCVWIRLLDWVRNKTWWWQEQPAPGVNILLINRSEILGQWQNVVTWDTKFFAECLDDNSDTATIWNTTNTQHRKGNILSSWLQDNRQDFSTYFLDFRLQWIQPSFKQDEELQ